MLLDYIELDYIEIVINYNPSSIYWDGLLRWFVKLIEWRIDDLWSWYNFNDILKVKWNGWKYWYY